MSVSLNSFYQTETCYFNILKNFFMNLISQGFNDAIVRKCFIVQNPLNPAAPPVNLTEVIENHKDLNETLKSLDQQVNGNLTLLNESYKNLSDSIGIVLSDPNATECEKENAETLGSLLFDATSTTTTTGGARRKRQAEATSTTPDPTLSTNCLELRSIIDKFQAYIIEKNKTLTGETVKMNFITTSLDENSDPYSLARLQPNFLKTLADMQKTYAFYQKTTIPFKQLIQGLLFQDHGLSSLYFWYCKKDLLLPCGE